MGIEVQSTEEDYKRSQGSGGGSKPIAKGTAEYVIDKAEVKTSKGVTFYKVNLKQRDGKRLLFDNYLPLDVKKGQFARTRSLLESLGYSVKPNERGVFVAPEAKELIGLAVKNTIKSYQYSYGENAEGFPNRVSDWQNEFEALQADGTLKDATVEAEAGFYSVSDFFGEEPAGEPVEETWG